MSNSLKAVVIVVGVVVAILAREAIYTIAIVAFLVGIVGLIVQAVRRGPVKQWGVATAGALVLAIVFGSISGGSPAPTE